MPLPLFLSPCLLQMTVALVAVAALLGSQLAGSSAAVLPSATVWVTLALICIFVLGAGFVDICFGFWLSLTGWGRACERDSVLRVCRCRVSEQ